MSGPRIAFGDFPAREIPKHIFEYQKHFTSNVPSTAAIVTGSIGETEKIPGEANVPANQSNETIEGFRTANEAAEVPGIEADDQTDELEEIKQESRAPGVDVETATQEQKPKKRKGKKQKNATVQQFVSHVDDQQQRTKEVVDSSSTDFQTQEPFVFPEAQEPSSRMTTNKPSVLTFLDILHILYAFNNTAGIRDELALYPSHAIRQVLQEHRTIPILFHILRHREAIELIRVLVGYGADVNAVGFDDKIPFLAHAIMYSWIHLQDATALSETLFELGALMYAIPSDMYSDLTEPIMVDMTMSPNVTWCRREYRWILARALNPTMRYRLWQWHVAPVPNSLQMQVLESQNAEELFELHEQMVGQSYAVSKVNSALLGVWSTNQRLSDRNPLTFVFAGPKGTGKTRFATWLAELLDANCFLFDFSLIKRPIEFSGPIDSTSDLARFLRDNSGKRSVVIISKFMKADMSFFKSLLELLDTGQFETQGPAKRVIDCSKTMWIFVADFSGSEISQFYAHNLRGKPLREWSGAPYDRISSFVADHFEPRLSDLTSRLMHFIPFFPLAEEEAAVLAHRHLSRLVSNLKAKVDIGHGNLRGNIFLDIEDEHSVCRLIAKESYIDRQHARKIDVASIRDAVEGKLQALINDAWFRQNRVVDNSRNEGPSARFSVMVEGDGKRKTIKVKADGAIRAPRILPL